MAAVAFLGTDGPDLTLVVQHALPPSLRGRMIWGQIMWVPQAGKARPSVPGLKPVALGSGSHFDGDLGASRKEFEHLRVLRRPGLFRRPPVMLPRRRRVLT